jgi:hypothetical protein
VSLGEVELAKVVGNLLDDARLHGQPPLKVRVNRAGLIDQTGRAVTRLEDSGPGMDPQLLAAATRRPSGLSVEAQQLVPAVARVISCTGRRPRTVTADRGYGEACVEDYLQDLGVLTVVIPRKGPIG